MTPPLKPAPAVDEIDESSAPLIEHLAELRNRLIWSLLAFTVAMILCFFVWEPIYDFLTVPLCEALNSRGQDCALVFLSLQEGFFLAFSISVMAGLVLSFPVISYQMWRFVAPGLYRSEKAAFLPFLVASPFMFFLGAAFAYYVVTPMAFSFFLTFQDVGALVSDGVVAEGEGSAAMVFQGSAQMYLSLTMSFIVAFGLCFQLPVLLTLMGRAGIISSNALVRTRKYAVVAILILAAVATPPDMMSQIILFCAVYPLYEVSILLMRRHERKVEAQMRAEGLLGPNETLYGDGDAEEKA
ncbi:twin-arginine translocase subunit TatC [Rubellimicrobium roseum]|uniref:Sec-independent protein translocase protein TatC n=1 Tax=Rubellimicrobium roseum TaxID=687525 RepID=A0A5C4NGA1_9RHOB|nr:twin-arginine translocase subunit TatC [Rubellimicrobium roseum]TNC73761.1 twin-arginine translocase subunit TatC [Rubellimicrobium roseum]